MKKNLFLLVTIFFFSNAFSQGCSDAGFCTLENIKTTKSDSISKKNYFKVGITTGQADNDINIFGSYIEYGRKLSKSFDSNLKINYLSQSVDGFSSSAISDAFLNANYSINDNLKVTIGFKIPFTDGNLKSNGVSLPMDFQPSLGTFDIILGVSKMVNNFSFMLAFQQPLTQNKNQYLAIDDKYFSSNKFKRSGDVLFRVIYNYEFSDKFSISPSILPIYHLQDDKYTNALNEEVAINGSSGLTVNGNLFLKYNINKTNALELSFGTPFVVRDARPDGLTRSFIANLEYRINF